MIHPHVLKSIYPSQPYPSAKKTVGMKDVWKVAKMADGLDCPYSLVLGVKMAE
jgi:hypothetical protein